MDHVTYEAKTKACSRAEGIIQYTGQAEKSSLIANTCCKKFACTIRPVVKILLPLVVIKPHCSDSYQ